ncbi:MAG: galactose mutarotase [Lentisphaeria bacterium]|nr:galactose mutarotase [Lentisphaeria bacterium]
MKKELFFTLPGNRCASLFKLRLPDGFGADITDFGGCIVSLFTPDAAGKLTDVALGWKDPAGYITNPTNFGAIIGRIANRISGGKFELDGELYQLYLNDNRRCSLHGSFGFSHRLWNVENASDTELTLTLSSPHGDAGFPGQLFIRATYRLLTDHTLEMEISAESDRPTVADFTNHTYFNLDGENAGSTADHVIMIAADRYTQTDQYLQPTGRIIEVDNSRFDLRQGKRFSTIFAEYDGGFDDNFILGDADHCYRENVATVTAGYSGIRLTIHTSRPGIQLYMGNFLNDHGKSPYPRNSGFCLETQCWPDAVNHPAFPSVRVEPGKPHHSITRYNFSIFNG